MEYSVCIEMLFAELPFEERIRRVARAGFRHVEFWCWWNRDMDAVARACRENDIQVSGICTRFLPLTDPEQADAYLDGLKETVRAARRLNCPNVITQTGCDMGTGVARQHAAVTATLKRCATLLRDTGITLLVEPVNRGEIPGYFLTGADEAGALLREVADPRVRMLYDIYHQQITEGDLFNHLHRNIDVIGHIHAAGVPRRTELDHSELQYQWIFDRLGEMGYQKLVGLEYNPSEPVLDGLRRLPVLP